MEFPPSWNICPLEDYETALPSVSSSSEAYTMELLAQLRSSGRILDVYEDSPGFHMHDHIFNKYDHDHNKLLFDHMLDDHNILYM